MRHPGPFTSFIILLAMALALGLVIRYGLEGRQPGKKYHIGQVIDRYNGVAVHYNGDVGNVSGRNTAADGYNLGLKYQCVEFVKRYYYEHLGHKMPNSYGHAKDFFNPKLADGQMNADRNLKQFSNPSYTTPQPDDLLVFGATPFNRYGHVAIISKVESDEVEIVQQNPGFFGGSRKRIRLSKKGNLWMLEDKHILGWLRKS